ncbi:hypothetical protein ABI59_20315 [Acidobacteria bacterium Mor1]|nr:hypothetical protein ABI59_20315 [Acidobacteria bacterium Mor1]
MPERSGLPDFLRRYGRLAAVNILSNLTVPLAGLVDTAMLGHLDEIRFLAGVALAAILFEYIYWTFGFLRMGTTGTAAQALGRRDERELSLVLYRALALAVAISGVILLLQWPLRELGLAVLQGDPGVEEAARDYFDALVWGAPAALCNFALVGWFLGRAEGRAALAMTAVANLGNVAFNYLFIVELGWAARGAGLGTMLSQYLSLGAGLILLSRRRRSRWIWSEVLDRARLTEVMKLNADILIRTLCLVSSFAVFTNFGAMLGVQLLAANTILLRVLTLAAHLIDGAAFATESIAGILHGRGDRAGLRRLLRLSLWVGEGFAVAVLAVVLIAPRPLLGLLTSHGDVIDRAVELSPWLIPVLVFGALAYMLDGFFLGLTAGPTLRRAMLVSTLVVFLPAALLALRFESAWGLWAAMAAFMLARTVTLGWAARPALN